MRGEDDEVPGEARITGMEAGEMEIQIDHRCHEVGFSCAHRQAVEVERIVEVVQEIVEETAPLAFLAMPVFEHLAAEIFEIVSLRKMMEEIAERILVQVGSVRDRVGQGAISDEIAEGGISPDKFEPEINLNGFPLRLPEFSDGGNMQNNLSGQ